ncbi:hypothetical protein BBJ28_00004080 [Nothophytophthora sp. Chile5]|nr:hypothetical protein BBJ28_00004080 [Nothophytophthora sp. Chile5]
MESLPCQPSPLLAYDDSATLEAALAFVGGCDGPPTARDNADARETSAIFASVHELLAEWDHVDDQFQEDRAQPAVCTQLRSRNNTNSKARRQTPSQEIQQLRLEEYELSTELEKLQFDARREALRIGEGKPHVLAPLVFWQQTAARQNQYRLDSERENRRLRELSNAQKRRAKQLQQVWRRQLDTMVRSNGVLLYESPYQNVLIVRWWLHCVVMQELGHAVGSTLRDGNATSSSDLSSEASDMLSELLSEVESMYAGLDGFLAARRRHERDEGFFHEYAKAQDVPFEKGVVDHAIWSVLAFHTGQQWRDIVCDVSVYLVDVLDALLRCGFSALMWVYYI